MPGCIPIFHEVAACKAAHYQYFGDWQTLTPEQQAFLIAHYIMEKQVNTHSQDAEAREQDKRTKNSSRRGRRR